MSTISQIVAIIRKELYQRRWALFGYCLGAVSFLLLYILIYPSFQSETAKFNELLEAYPKALLQAFNIDKLQLSTFEGYISVEHFSFVWPLMAIFLSMSFAGVAFAGEVEKGTMAFLLSQPISRARIFISKYLSAIIALICFVTLSVIAVIPLASIQNISVSSANIINTAIISLGFAWAIYALAVMVSSITSERSKSYFAIGGLLLLMYVANVVSGLVSGLDWLKYSSFFHYYQPAKILVGGAIETPSMLVFSATIIVSSVIGFVLFLRRDMSV
jgi:ABC-2 type transport system permease protein